jgi:hypothetical protein
LDVFTSKSTFLEHERSQQMGYIPKDAEWYLAEVIEEITVEDEPNNVVHFNWILVHAHSPEEAYSKALEHGRAGEVSYENPDGKLVRISFRGLHHLDVIHDKLEDGAEITYDERVGVPEEELQEYITPKDDLNVFRPFPTAFPPERPDYTSKEIMGAVEAFLARLHEAEDEQ